MFHVYGQTLYLVSPGHSWITSDLVSDESWPELNYARSCIWSAQPIVNLCQIYIWSSQARFIIFCIRSVQTSGKLCQTYYLISPGQTLSNQISDQTRPVLSCTRFRILFAQARVYPIFYLIIPAQCKLSQICICSVQGQSLLNQVSD